ANNSTNPTHFSQAIQQYTDTTSTKQPQFPKSTAPPLLLPIKKQRSSQIEQKASDPTAHTGYRLLHAKFSSARIAEFQQQQQLPLPNVPAAPAVHTGLLIQVSRDFR
ncbi:hypothetical protein AABB24_002161, partial [Solanum stoloniferum]